MKIDKKLLDILVCPLCKGKLIYDKKAPELICPVDRLAYPVCVRDGVPMMLAVDARQLPADEEIST